MVLITNVWRHSMSETRAVVFHNNYAPLPTGTEKCRITKMTTRWPAAIFIKAPTWRKPLFRSAWRYKYNFGGFRVFLTRWHTTRARKLAVPVGVGQSKHVAVSNPLIGSAKEGIHRCGSCFALLIILSFFRSMFVKHLKQIKGFGRKLLSRPRHLILPHVGRCSSVVCARDWRYIYV